MDAPTDPTDKSQFARARFRCTVCGADHRPKRDRWTALAVATQWVNYSIEVGGLGWLIRRRVKPPFDNVMHCDKCVKAAEEHEEKAGVVA